MNITSFHIQHVIKAYGQRIGRRSGSRLKLTGGSKGQTPDIISISTEAKRRQVIDQITHDIVSRAKGQDKGFAIQQNVFEKIGERLGGSIDLIKGDDQEPDFKFRVLSDKEGDGETLKELSISDLKKMVDNLYSDEIHTENEK